MATRTRTRRRTPAPARASKAVAVRHAPQQDRGQKRFEDVLDAAEQVIAEVGVAAMTTNAVAERAGAGMGSLYRFFANKDAILTALAERYTRAMEPLTAYAGRPELRTLPLASLAEAVVDPLAAFFHSRPAYGHVFHAVNQPGTRNPGCEELRRAVVHNVEALLAARVPGTRPARRHVHALFSVDFVHAMLSSAFESPASERAAILDETKRLLALYAEMIEREDDPLERLRRR